MLESFYHCNLEIILIRTTTNENAAFWFGRKAQIPRATKLNM